MACGVCSSFTLSDALDKVFRKSGGGDTLVDLVRMPLRDFMAKCHQGLACPVCVATADQFMAMDVRFTSKPDKDDPVIIFIRIDGPAWRLMYRNGQHHWDVNWMIWKDTAHLIDKDPMGINAFRHASQWLQHCRQHHAQCFRPSPEFMPTRLLDVSESDTPDIRLVCSVSPNHGHRVEPAPQNFVDAVRVTRRLGFRYLWIDSLCIIQGDRDDWAEESAKMESVYSNADLVIVASRAGSPTDGFLTSRAETVLTKNETLPTGDTQTFHLVNRDFNYGDPSRFIPLEPLSKRAWAVQERCCPCHRQQDGGMYCAGIWIEYFVCDLLWYPSSWDAPGVARKKKRKSFVAPSFSWAASQGEVHFKARDKFSKSYWLARYITHGQQLSEGGRDIYGALKSAWLAMRAPLVHVTSVECGVDGYAKLQFTLDNGRSAYIDALFDHMETCNDPCLSSDDIFLVPLYVTGYPGEWQSARWETEEHRLDSLILVRQPSPSRSRSFGISRTPLFHLEPEGVILLALTGQSNVPRFRRLGICRMTLFQFEPEGSWGFNDLDRSNERNEAFRLFLNQARRQMQDVVLV
ncbi:hypothetical protein ACJZ2D_013784 [Fusarium nematophilum]